MDYFISDTHFGHYNLYNMERIDYNDETFTEVVFNALRRLTENDTLYHLGDIGNLTVAAELFKQLPCKKILITGNHDKCSCQWYKTHWGFDEVYIKSYWYTNRILLSHEPMQVDDSCLNIHGHLHSASLSLSNYINVNIYDNNFKLITAKQILNKLHNIPKTKTPFLWEWYAPYYLFTNTARKDIIFYEDGSLDLIKSREKHSEILRTNNRRTKDTIKQTSEQKHNNTTINDNNRC